MEALTRKKKVRGGHRSSANRTISQIYETIESTENPESTLTKLKQCKMALEEKLEVVKRCDEEILELTREDDVENEIEQADVFKEKVQRAVIDVTNAITTKETPTAPMAVTTKRFTSYITPTYFHTTSIYSYANLIYLHYFYTTSIYFHFTSSYSYADPTHYKGKITKVVIKEI